MVGQITDLFREFEVEVLLQTKADISQPSKPVIDRILGVSDYSITSNVLLKLLNLIMGSKVKSEIDKQVYRQVTEKGIDRVPSMIDHSISTLDLTPWIMPMIKKKKQKRMLKGVMPALNKLVRKLIQSPDLRITSQCTSDRISIDLPKDELKSVFNILYTVDLRKRFPAFKKASQLHIPLKNLHRKLDSMTVSKHLSIPAATVEINGLVSVKQPSLRVSLLNSTDFFRQLSVNVSLALPELVAPVESAQMVISDVSLKGKNQSLDDTPTILGIDLKARIRSRL